MLPQAARDRSREVASEELAALGSIRRSWRQMTDDFDVSWESQVGPRVLAATVAAQDAVATSATRYVPDVLVETGQRVAAPQWEMSPRAWAGTAGDGRAVQSLAYGAVIKAKMAVGRGATVERALQVGGRWLTKAMGTVVSDTARSAERLSASAHHKPLYVRMLNPGACGRCVILAGRTYRTAFERHPQCLCVSIPTSESIAGDMLTDPVAYLDSLDDDQLAKALGSKANAVAYREFGADQNQIINAYRARRTPDGYVGSVHKAQVYGRTIKYTTEGTTRRGWAGQSMRQAGYVRDPRGRLTTPRLMPETILDIAENRADAERMLRLYGWVL